MLLTAATSRALGRFVCGHSRRLLRVAIRLLLPPVLGRALAACMMAAVTAAIRPLSVVPAAGTPHVLERHLVLLLRLGLGLIRGLVQGRSGHRDGFRLRLRRLSGLTIDGRSIGRGRLGRICNRLR